MERSSVHVAAVSDGHDDDKKDFVDDAVDDPVVPDSQPVSRAAAQRPGCRRSRVFGEERDCSLNAPSDMRIELAKGPGGGRADLDSVTAHTQPRSIFTCSQGMLSSSSAIAASKAAMSSTSSSASTSSS